LGEPDIWLGSQSIASISQGHCAARNRIYFQGPPTLTVRANCRATEARMEEMQQPIKHGRGTPTSQIESSEVRIGTNFGVSISSRSSWMRRIEMPSKLCPIMRPHTLSWRTCKRVQGCNCQFFLRYSEQLILSLFDSAKYGT
jgi:hypothetical protein